MVRRAAVCLAVLFAGCSSSNPPASAPMIAPVMVSLVESEPVETALDRPDILNAYDVWLEMFRNAKRSIDIAQFYASEADEKWLGSSKLTAILQALVDAHKRGVKVRFLVDEKFVPQYPTTVELLEKSGFDVRRIKGDALFGGVQHAKYFVVDGFTTFIGSQNFDWRAIDHIQEMGVRLYSTEIASQLLEVFETDWALAGGAAPSTRVQLGIPPGRFPGIEAHRVEFTASPREWLPDESIWDLPKLIGLINAAKHSVKVQVLKYKTANRDGSRFADLDDALRRAAARGVKVQLLVSEWALKDKSLEALQQLADVADIRVIKIPAFSGGEIPFARVAHAKYMIVDGNAAWIGTSNWEGDYFTKSRNVGVILQDGEVPTRLAKFFDENWAGTYVSKIPARAAEVPSAQ
ncbi:MAG TPA: phospholipase D-like domain-containing protein [Polyangium sp.]|nr:phospholipase D-like domain-containing protein [Polyangium sp.]